MVFISVLYDASCTVEELSPSQEPRGLAFFWYLDYDKIVHNFFGYNYSYSLTLKHSKIMADEDEIAALVIDNGSGMCKGGLILLRSKQLFDAVLVGPIREHRTRSAPIVIELVQGSRFVPHHYTRGYLYKNTVVLV